MGWIQAKCIGTSSRTREEYRILHTFEASCLFLPHWLVLYTCTFPCRASFLLLLDGLSASTDCCSFVHITHLFFLWDVQSVVECGESQHDQTNLWYICRSWFFHFLEKSNFRLAARSLVLLLTDVASLYSWILNHLRLINVERPRWHPARHPLKERDRSLERRRLFAAIKSHTHKKRERKQEM